MGVGLAVAGAFTIADLFLPIQLAAALSLAAGTILTGAIHIDGLADFADGVFGGRNAQDRLRIMKLPDVGAFGVAAVGLIVLIDWAAISSMATANIWVIFAVVGLMSRTAPLVVMATTSYVSPGGLGRSYSTLSRSKLLSAILVALAVAFVAGGWLALAAGLAGLAAAFVVGLVANRRLGGATGDIYGAAVEVTYAVCLVAAAAILDAGDKFEPLWHGL